MAFGCFNRDFQETLESTEKGTYVFFPLNHGRETRAFEGGPLLDMAGSVKAAHGLQESSHENTMTPEHLPPQPRALLLPATPSWL